MTTHKNTWKQLERDICKKFGAKRTPLSGSNSGHNTSSDCIELSPEFQKFYIEIKLRAKFSHHETFRDVKQKAKNEQKIPLLITHEKYERGALVILRMDDFLELIKKWNIK